MKIRYFDHTKMLFMRKLLLPFCLVAFAASAQQTIHSSMNGNASSPLTWDCLCFPTPDDIVIVDHQVTMDVDWAVTAGGRIEVSPGASLLQDADRQLLVDGTGAELRVYGTASFTDVAFTNSASGLNSGTFSVDRGLYFGNTTSYTNSGQINGLDSLMTEGDFTNSGTFYAGNFLNTGDFENTGTIGADSMGNTGTFLVTSGYLGIATFGNNGYFFLTGSMDVSGNWYNAENFSINSGALLSVAGNAYSGDTLGGNAVLTCAGTMVVTGDFGLSDNCIGDGDICVGGYSANAGAVNGSIDFCDATGGDFDLQVGTINPGVTFCTAGCHLDLEEGALASAALYPNPATTVLEVKSDVAFETAIFYSVTGERVNTLAINNHVIAIDHLAPGVYFVQLNGKTATQPMKIVIE